MKISFSTNRLRHAVLALAAVSSLALVVASPAGAVTGPGAYGERVDVTTAGIATSSGPLPEVHAPADGSTATDSVASVNADPLLTTGLLEVTSNQGFSRASVNQTSALDGRVTALVLSAECTGPLGRTDLAGLTIGDSAVSANPHPNTTLLNAAGVTIVANRQYTSGNDFVVRALEITLTNAVIKNLPRNGTIVISEARCNREAPIPAGAIGGLALAAILGVLFVGQQAISRRRRMGRTASTPAEA